MILFLLFEHACVCVYTDLEKHLPVYIAIVAITMGLGRWLRTWHACLTSGKAWMWAPRTHVKLDIVAHIYNLHVPTSRWGTKTWEHYIPLAWNPWRWATEDTVGNGVKDGGGHWGFLLISSHTCTHALKHGWASTTHTKIWKILMKTVHASVCVFVSMSVHCSPNTDDLPEFNLFWQRLCWRCSFFMQLVWDT